MITGALMVFGSMQAVFVLARFFRNLGGDPGLTLIVMVHGHKCPVCNNTSDAECAVCVLAGDEIFDCSGIEELDVGKGKDAGEEG
jgi:hypothetical protein